MSRFFGLKIFFCKALQTCKKEVDLQEKLSYNKARKGELSRLSPRTLPQYHNQAGGLSYKTQTAFIEKNAWPGVFRAPGMRFFRPGDFLPIYNVFSNKFRNFKKRNDISPGIW